jgi:hypothetical protein
MDVTYKFSVMHAFVIKPDNITCNSQGEKTRAGVILPAILQETTLVDNAKKCSFFCNGIIVIKK